MHLPPWSQLVELLRVETADARETKSWSKIAKEIGISRPGLQNVLSEGVEEPRQKTQEAIYRWIQARGGNVSVMGGNESAKLPGVGGEPASEEGQPEEELLEYFVQHHEQMAIFMSTTTEGLSAADRRKVALAILNGFKKLAIQAGEPIPPVLYDIERRFVADTE